MIKLKCFKACDIRGRVPDELNTLTAYRIGRAYAKFLKCKRVVVGRDMRLSSTPLCRALAQGLMDGGTDVYDIGVCGTEQLHFATFRRNMDGGIMVTACHDSSDYNGMKLVGEGSRPIGGDSSLLEIKEIAERIIREECNGKGSLNVLDIEQDYIEHLMGYVEPGVLKTFKVVANAGNGCAGRIIDLLEQYLPFSFVKIHHEPDGTFPNGIPNPLLPENRQATADAVRNSGADIGIAWDVDFNRCFLFDENGAFIEGYYIVGLLASAMLAKHKGARIVHDPRLTWNTVDIVGKAGGVPIMSKTGHAFIKERMRAEDAVYGGEISAHHYFRDFDYCESGMIPWLIVLELMSKTGKPLSELVGERMRMFPVSGEISMTVMDAAAVLAKIEADYVKDALNIDRTYGLSMEFGTWRFNVRSSNSESLLLLNVETRGDKRLMGEKTAELLDAVDNCGRVLGF